MVTGVVGAVVGPVGLVGAAGWRGRAAESEVEEGVVQFTVTPFNLFAARVRAKFMRLTRAPVLTQVEACQL